MALSCFVTRMMPSWMTPTLQPLPIIQTHQLSILSLTYSPWAKSGRDLSSLLAEWLTFLKVSGHWRRGDGRGKPILLRPSAHNNSLNLTSGYDMAHPIQVPQISPYDSYRTLGAYLSPSGYLQSLPGVKTQFYQLSHENSLLQPYKSRGTLLLHAILSTKSYLSLASHDPIRTAVSPDSVCFSNGCPP